MNALSLVSEARNALTLDLVPPDTLDEARRRRDALAQLLGREREAAADFLLALADFDRRRGWERLGHASLFAFLTRELGLSNGAAYLRLTAARLLPRFPAVETALRQGKLCLSAVGELGRVLTADNEAEVLPRFFGRSSREAREVAAAIRPDPSPARRETVTMVTAGRRSELAAPVAVGLSAAPGELLGPVATGPMRRLELAPKPLPTATDAAASLRAHEVAPTHPDRDARPSVEPLTEELRRLHVTVTVRFLEKVSAARDGLSHALPGATTEQVLEAALDLLLEQQARRKALVRRPRVAPSTLAPTSTTMPTPAPAPAANTPSIANTPPIATAPATPTSPPTSPRRPHLPAAIEREVRLRDGDRCQFSLDSGGVCGSTWQVELDHLVPVALGGPTTAANLRCACRFHNRLAAAQALGPVAAAIRRRE